MSRLSDLVLELVCGIPVRVGEPDDGIAVRVDQLRVELPIEARLTSEPQFCVPGRVHTGFDLPVARITLGLERREGKDEP